MTQPQIYILFGSDEFAIAGQAQALLHVFSDPTAADLNTSRLDARVMTEDELNNAVNAVPFLAELRLVLLTAPSKRYSGAEGHRKFTAFLNAVPSTTRLVIVEPGEIKEREKPNHWLLKWVHGSQGLGEAREFNLPRQSAMPGWIVNETRKQGGQIEPPAAARLAEMVGEDTRQAAGEITKLLTYVNYAHPIGPEDVEAVSIVNVRGDVFSLVDAIAMGNGRRAQSMLHQLLEQDEPFSIFGMVVRQFRLLIIARETMDDGGGQTAVVEALGIHPYAAEKVYNQARAFRMQSLEVIYHRLLQIDEDAKTSQVPLDLALDMFIAQTGQR
jgi:DNA polymerase III subunit delta